jgi:predicted nucleotidyltransferase
MISNFDDFIKYTNFDKKEKYNIYLTGSRIYGTNNENSDYDFWVIVKKDYFIKLKKKFILLNNDEENNNNNNDNKKIKITEKNNDNKNEFYECIYLNNNININLYEKKLFKKNLKNNNLQSLMSYFSEENNILKLDFSFKNKFSIKYRKLGRSVIGIYLFNILKIILF